MVSQDSLLVTLVQLVDRLPIPNSKVKRGRAHPIIYTDWLFLKALVIMIVRHLHKVNELLSVLAQPTAEMATLGLLLSEQGRFPARHTWERRLKALPASLLAQIGCLGRYLVGLIQPWLTHGRAVAIDSTLLRAGPSGIRSTARRANSRIPRLIRRPTGPHRVARLETAPRLVRGGPLVSHRSPAHARKCRR